MCTTEQHLMPQVERCARDMTQEQLQQLHASKTFQMLCGEESVD